MKSPRKRSRRCSRHSAHTGPRCRPRALVAAEVLASPSATTTVTLRSGTVQIQDGPFADTKEALAGVFVIDVPDSDAALMWAERCPGAQYGVVEVRAAATSFVDGSWI